MVEVTRIHLSGSTDGIPIAISSTSAPGNMLHTSTATANVLDEVWLWATNDAGASIDLTVAFDGGTSGKEIRQAVVNGNGDNLILQGATLNNGRVLSAFATASGINIHGHVNRIDQSA